MATFNGHPGQEGYDRLEVMSTNPETGALELHELTFSKAGEGPVQFSEKNPVSCLRCHGADPAPILENYNQWPGFYGANDDSVQDDPKRGCDFKKFKAQYKENNRYSQLEIDDPKNPVFPYYLGGEDRGLHHMANSRLTNTLSVIRARHLLQKIKKHPIYKESLFSLTYLQFCPVLDFQFDDAAEVKAYGQGLSQGENNQFAKELKRKFAIPAGDFSLMATGIADPSEISNGFPYAREEWTILGFELMRELAAQDPEFAKVYAENTQPVMAGKEGSTLYAYQNSLQTLYADMRRVKGPLIKGRGGLTYSHYLCQALEKRAKAEFEILRELPAECAEVKRGANEYYRENLQEFLRISKKLTAHSPPAELELHRAGCIDCHDGSSGASRFRFDDPEAFKQDVRSWQENAKKSFITEADRLLRCATNKYEKHAATHMPLKRPCLNPRELKVVQDYFNETLGPELTPEAPMAGVKTKKKRKGRR